MSKGKILVVDDSPLVRKLAEVSLIENNYEVYTAADGEEGLNIAKNVKPDLILVDFIMPKITGSQFCKLLRENEELKDIPIILITGKGETVGQTFIEKYGVIDYFIKPFKSEDLLSKVDSILAKTTKPLVEISETYEEQHIEELRELEEIIAPASSFEHPQIEEITPLEEKKEPLSFGDIPMDVPTDLMKEYEIKEGEKIIDNFEFEQTKPTEKISEITDIPFLNIEEELELDKSQLPETIEMQERAIEEQLIQAPEIEPLTETKKEELSLENILDRFSITPEIPDIQALIKTELPEKVMDSEQQKLVPKTHEAYPDIETIINNKLNDFVVNINSLIEESIEKSLKKYGLIKDSSIVLNGNLETFGFFGIFNLITSKNLTGILLIFENSVTYEFLLIEGKIVYGVSSLQKQKIDNKLLINLSESEIEEFLKDNLKNLINAKGSFIFELKEIDDLRNILHLKRYDLQNFFNNI